MSLYPFKFKPRYLEKMWGGRKIETILGKPLPTGKAIGESWEIYDFPPGVIDPSPHWISSEVANGPLAGKTLHELMLEFENQLYGSALPVGPNRQFPLLIKYLDAREDLSVQVHPDEDYAARNPGAHLKSEAWYIVQADENARLLKGLNRGITRESFESAIKQGTVESSITSIPVQPGQCFYLPSGTVHALGAGILAAEVQTPSDTTFRVFDFNRIDPSTGKLRTLHVEKAMQCIDFSPASQGTDPPRIHRGGFFPHLATHLVENEYFTIAEFRTDKSVETRLPINEAAIWMILQGGGEWKVNGIDKTIPFTRGDTLLLPAFMENPVVNMHAESRWLHITFAARA
jgi:mannose-6-phosphate isomerase